ncbi:MAG: flagellar biosynthesis protein FlgF [Hyphomicrobiales bacterium]|nr:flagellar biosynthesis protein FlgF [Hyphomicrobiales bacterium]
MDTFTSYNVLTRTMAATLARTAKDPSVKRETAYYESKIGSIKTIDDFVKDPRILTYALKAWGLEDMSYAKGLIKKVLEGGIDDSRSLANTLSSGRFKEFASVFNFKSYGPATTAFDKVQKTTVDNYVQQKVEADQGASNPALKFALYFQRKAPTIKSAIYILADTNLLKVVQTTLNIPASTSNSSIDAQVALINQKMNVADLQDPAKLTKFLQRFTVAYDAANGTPGVSAANVMLGGGGSGTIGLNSDLLMSIQRMR